MQKIASVFMSAAIAFLSLFGYSFTPAKSTYPTAFAKDKPTVSPNENTEKLKTLLEAVKARTPDFTVCQTKKPFPGDDRISAIYFDGEEYSGKPAEVFAYVGIPEGASAANPVPAMVLVHGGAGHAYAEWVRYWVDNGYAAISLDGFGQEPVDGEYTGDGTNEGWVLNPDSHPTIDEFRSIDKPIGEQWYYYYITDVILAHNLLRADSRVDTSKIGITGISWGSYATSTVICYDDRFAFAVPVYGSGYQFESTGIFGGFTSGAAEIWDASLLLPEVKMPVLFLNSDSDIFFSANTTTHSAAAAPNADILLKSGLSHSQTDGAYIPEILRFANEQTGKGEGNIKLDSVSFNGRKAIVAFTLPEDVGGAKLSLYYRSSPLEYISDSPFNLKDSWKVKKGIVIGNTGCVKIPADAETFYLAVSGKVGGLFGKTKLLASTGLYSEEDVAFMRGLNADKLSKAIKKTAEKNLDEGKIGCADIIVNQNGERIYEGLFGTKTVGGEALEKDSIFRMASMTKPVTAVALLIEAERGSIDLYADVSDYLDGFDNMYIGKMVDGKVVADHKAQNSVKVYQLVSHTSGIGSGVVGEAVYGGIKPADRTVKAVAEYLADKPLDFDPGTSQGYSTAAFDVAARIIEIRSGLPFDEYLKVNIFDKLGMKDTFFTTDSEEQWSRLVGIHGRDENGAPFNEAYKPNTVFANFPAAYFCAGGGLASTAEDYMKFAEMLLNEGKAPDGTRILSAESVKLMRTPVVSDEIMPGNQKWGLGVRVITGDYSLPVGSFGWSGMYGTHFWVDPENRITAVYMKNSTYDGGAGCKTSVEFENDVMNSLVK